METDTYFFYRPLGYKELAECIPPEMNAESQQICDPPNVMTLSLWTQWERFPPKNLRKRPEREKRV